MEYSLSCDINVRNADNKWFIFLLKKNYVPVEDDKDMAIERKNK